MLLGVSGAFLRADFVDRLGWLTDQQLLDAIAIGQITPGPLSSTATFIGYLLGGFPGAGVATLGMFLPSFLFVAILNPILPKLLQAKSFRAFLDGVNIGALSLMTFVTVFLAQSSLVDPLTVAVAIATLFLLIKYQINSLKKKYEIEKIRKPNGRCFLSLQPGILYTLGKYLIETHPQANIICLFDFCEELSASYCLAGNG